MLEAIEPLPPDRAAGSTGRSMRYLVLSDIHANLQALDAVLADAGRARLRRRCSCSAIWSATAPTRRPSSTRTLALAPMAMIRGNHDKVCAGIEPPSHVQRRRARVDRMDARALLDAEQLAHLAALPTGAAAQCDAGSRSATARRSTRTTTSSTQATRRARCDAATARICLFGHTHVPARLRQRRSAEARTPTDSPTTSSDCRGGPALINVGSVGQPRDGDPRAAYGSARSGSDQRCRLAARGLRHRRAQARSADSACGAARRRWPLGSNDGQCSARGLDVRCGASLALPRRSSRRR